MNLYKRVNKFFALSQFLFLPHEKSIYSGFVGHHNLGDEALWQAISELLKPLDLYVNPTPASSYAKKVIQLKKHHLAVLGGGTLIGSDLKDGSNPFRESFKQLLLRSQQSITFGTGVGKISSPEDQTWLMAWKPLLEKCYYIGVRGPDSVETLTNIGLKNVDLLGDAACFFAQKSGFWTP